MTGLAGLPVYLEFAHLMGLPRLIADHVRARQGDHGWTDDQMIMALVALNLAGGDCVDDLRVLEGDEGFCRVQREIEFYGRTRSEKRALKRRWRKQRTRTFPSPKGGIRRTRYSLKHEGGWHACAIRDDAGNGGSDPAFAWS